MRLRLNERDPASQKDEGGEEAAGGGRAAVKHRARGGGCPLSALLGVPLEVFLEVLPQHEALSAHLAAVVAHARVHQVVPVQVALEAELAPADGARKLPRRVRGRRAVGQAPIGHGRGQSTGRRAPAAQRQQVVQGRGRRVQAGGRGRVLVVATAGQKVV